MNLHNAWTLVHQLEGLPDEKFSMGDWIDCLPVKDADGFWGCETVGCIAGWCCLLNNGPTQDSVAIETFACKFLRLNWEEASDLFLGRWSPKQIEDITRRDAINQLYRLIAHEPTTHRCLGCGGEISLDLDLCRACAQEVYDEERWEADSIESRYDCEMEDV